MTTDPMDLPDGDDLQLVMPFVACESSGGPYDDQSYTAGFQTGQIYTALRVSELIGADWLSFTVYAPLREQLELVGMATGYPTAHFTPIDDAGLWLRAEFVRGGCESELREENP